jgi:hypothetical protein
LRCRSLLIRNGWFWRGRTIHLKYQLENTPVKQ